MISTRHLWTALAALAASALTAQAQTSVIDEGTFRLSVRGTTVGTETFTIRRSGSGANATTVAQGRIVLETGQQTQAVLELQGASLRPAAYQIEVRGDDRQNITGRAAGNRFRATIVSSSGEQMREYLASQGAVVLDEGVAHQYYFLASEPLDGHVPIIIPRQSRQVSATVAIQGSETITIADTSVQARRIHVQPQGLAERIVWVDDQGRVLRLQIPADDFVAERTALP